jgi:predicted molibdopterin-dependent oxidoreductase YjgC
MTARRARTRRDEALRVLVNDTIIEAFPGETVAAVLLVSGQAVFRYSRTGEGRGPFCLMGICQECLVEIDGIPNRRSCLQPVAEGMQIRSGAR